VSVPRASVGIGITGMPRPPDIIGELAQHADFQIDSAGQSREHPVIAPGHGRNQRYAALMVLRSQRRGFR